MDNSIYGVEKTTVEFQVPSAKSSNDSKTMRAYFLMINELCQEVLYK